MCLMCIVLKEKHVIYASNWRRGAALALNSVCAVYTEHAMHCYCEVEHLCNVFVIHPCLCASCAADHDTVTVEPLTRDHHDNKLPVLRPHFHVLFCSHLQVIIPLKQQICDWFQPLRCNLIVPMMTMTVYRARIYPCCKSMLIALEQPQSSSWLCLSLMVPAGYICVAIIHPTLTWTKDLFCAHRC